MRKIISVIILSIVTKGFAQEKIQNVEATTLNYKDKKYGVEDLNLLMYPTIDKLKDTLLNYSESKKCKVYIKLKIDSDSNSITKEDVVSDCRFEKNFDFEQYIRNNFNIHVLSIRTEEKFIKMTVPIYIYSGNGTD